MSEHLETFFSSLEAWHETPQHHRAETVERFAKMMKEMTTREEFNFTTFPSSSTDMVVLERIPFYTLCAHHIVPFFGYAYVGYVPEGRIAGISKFARAVQQCAKGFHVQEELTKQIADFLEKHLFERTATWGTHAFEGGLAIVLRAEHMCMAMRGVKVPGVMTTTSRMTGVFADHERTAKAEFMEIVRSQW